MTDVSRETSELLARYADLVEKWQDKINLVSTDSLADFEARHVQDSLQIIDLAPIGWKSWVDLGSGGGLPGIVVAISAKLSNPNAKITLVESDRRKVAFLKTVIRELSLNAEVETTRIEHAFNRSVDVISARALAPLPKLISYAQRFSGEQTCMLFHKGKTWKDEVRTAGLEWSFDMDVIQSKTSPEAVILKIKEVRRA